uniref:Uncharacterized protein n=2 Tax=Anguilla anguilla TaxID=7936 RepID=A0A0E9UM71_ANGAN
MSTTTKQWFSLGQEPLCLPIGSLSLSVFSLALIFACVRSRFFKHINVEVRNIIHRQGRVQSAKEIFIYE